MNDTTPWLERELSRQLAPVGAPESLWYRIQTGRPTPRRDSFRWAVWPAVALVTLIICAAAFRQMSIIGTERLTAQDLAELAQTSRDFNFRSEDFGAIRSWIKAEANVDIDLPDGPTGAESAQIRLLGVRLTRLRGVPVAAIDYRVGSEMATLLVSARHSGLAADSGTGRHMFSTMKATGTRLVSWNMRDQSYAIAFSGTGNMHEACMLCHANMPAMIAIN